MRRSIAGRLLFWFLVIALIPCAILTAITARIAASSLEKSVRDTLVQTAAGKAGELEAYAGERVRDGAALARGPTVVQAVSDLARAAESEDDPRGRLNAAAAAVTPYLTYVAQAFGYEQLLLIDKTGQVLFSLAETIPPGTSLTAGGLASSELATGFDRAKTLLQSDLSGFQQYGAARQPLAFVTCPVFDEGRLTGVLALGLGPQRIWQVLSDFSGLGETGEVVAGQFAGD